MTENSTFETLTEVAQQLQALAPQETATETVVAISNLCIAQNFEEARDLAQKSYGHLEFWYHGLNSALLTNKTLTKEVRGRMSNIADLIEQAQRLCIRLLGVRPTDAVSPLMMERLYTSRREDV